MLLLPRGARRPRGPFPALAAGLGGGSRRGGAAGRCGTPAERGAGRRRMSGHRVDGAAAAAPAPALSARGARIAGGAPGLLDAGFALYVADPFDRERNPQGILNLGTSENKLCFDLIEERFTRPDMNYLEPDLFQYSDTQGTRSFREEIAKFLTDYARAAKALNPEHITVMNGCCSVFATLSTVLCDSGDGYLIPAPYYGGINSKTWLYGGIQPVHVPLFSEVADEESHPFQLTVEKLEAALQKAKKQGIRVRALILINPRNPLGDIYPAQLLKECLEFAHRYELHVIMDEIYMLSVYDDTAFTSVLSLDCLPDPERTHFMWGFSKDFGMSGIRVGVLYTTNQEIRKAVNQLAVFHSCPGPVQHILSQFLRDRDWLDNVFFPTNKKRLKEAQNILVDGLADVGIPILKSSAGLYVWADFRKFLKSQTFEAELELWQKLLDKKVLISPGKAFYCYEPGWFRLVFSDSVDKIYLCIQRLEQMLHSYTAEPVTNTASSTADALCNPEKDSSDRPSNTPGKDVSQLKNILVY
ncbi:1-aminocyclopropane-1-carboxylate synthase-like protein 1 isoform X1 [Falco rusticolus]|uniref:1-aminocyclopropane-1-carboxylate synthase-like protein 1 isoform X1 n=1 Tax=Falco rusticolus TaxID=120794 RepID=UPI00188696E2|nr:1-aminocyclopropane-1-carboxylate synthase-like protein 1 isoform X1 [Falco rusticolus]